MLKVLKKESYCVIRKLQRKILLNKCLPLLNVDPSTEVLAIVYAKAIME